MPIEFSSQARPPLMRTKLVMPQRRAGLVLRSRLLDLLAESSSRALTLICAPAGYGKTTLLVDWVSSLQRKGITPGVCWLSLDDQDNDLPRFLAYLYEALKDILPKDQADVYQAILSSLRSSQEVDVQGLLTALLNDLYPSQRQVILILDDYHVIQDQSIHQAVRFLIKNLPQNVHLVIASRSDPPLGLANLRARDQLCEVRLADMAFTETEAAEFLNRQMTLDLSPEDIAALFDRTEGWAAGLQLAALAIQSPVLARSADRSVFIKNFSGSHRNILEYLTEEVFDQQPEAVQAFLLSTSILDRLCAPLCDAVLSRETARHSGPEAWITFSIPPSLNSQYFLDWLESHQLFLYPLDADHQWFRYHPLFADLLRGKLKHAHPGCAEILLARAAEWSEQQGLVMDAVAQALASNNPDLTADLFERHILSFFFHSEIAQVHRWLSAQPEEILRSRPLLCAVYAAAVALMPPYPPQSIQAAEKWMQAAEQSFTGDHQRDWLARAFSAVIRSFWARFLYEPYEKVLQLIEQADAILNEADSKELEPGLQHNLLLVQSALQTNLALTHWGIGNEPTAKQAFLQAREICSACGDLFNEVTAFYSLVRIEYLHGHLNEAVQLSREALEHFAHLQQLGHRSPFSGEIGVQLADILVEQNQLAEAEQMLKENIALAKWTMSHNILLRGELALARIALANGNPTEALVCLEEAAQLSTEGAGLAGAQRVRIWLALGQDDPQYLDLARQWVYQQGYQDYSQTVFEKGPPRMGWFTALAAARLEIQAGDPSRIRALLDWLDRQEQAVQERGWGHWGIQLRLVECLARQRIGDQPGALAVLKTVLELGEPGGYVRSFIEEGKPLRDLLSVMEKDAGKQAPYVRRLLAVFPDGGSRPAIQTTRPQGLAEPLTSRELEVLRLICQGLSNQEIADRLVVTLNTVKKHNYSIFEKLGVENRSQAILAAEKMSLCF